MAGGDGPVMPTGQDPSIERAAEAIETLSGYIKEVSPELGAVRGGAQFRAVSCESEAVAALGTSRIVAFAHARLTEGARPGPRGPGFDLPSPSAAPLTSRSDANVAGVTCATESQRACHRILVGRD